MKMQIIKYTSEQKNVWDNFIAGSKNGHFMFYRDYMEYHSNRFTDHSLLIFEDNKVSAVLPASFNKSENIVVSHAGLSFGGVVSDYKMSSEKMLLIFGSLLEFFKNSNIKRFIYKPIPHIYHIIPSEEDLYALFVSNAKLIRRDSSSVINLQENIHYYKGRKWAINKAKKSSVIVKLSDEYDTFISLLKTILNNKFHVEPTHTSEEIFSLSRKFPDNIKLYAAYSGNEMLGGTIVFVNKDTIHTQYIATSDKGKELGAVDLIIDELIKVFYHDKKYLSFGINNSSQTILNIGLSSQKEGFGARTIVHDFYELTI
jgi:hypothetical protein